MEIVGFKNICNRFSSKTQYYSVMSFTRNQDGSISVSFYGLLVFKIVELKTKYRLLVKYALKSGENEDIDKNGFFKYEIVDKNLDDLAFYVSEALAGVDQYVLDNYSPEPFGCCSKYMACSDAKKCLHDDKLRAKGCMYKANLDSGRIFYGKNRNIP